MKVKVGERKFAGTLSIKADAEGELTGELTTTPGKRTVTGRKAVRSFGRGR